MYGRRIRIVAVVVVAFLSVAAALAVLRSSDGPAASLVNTSTAGAARTSVQPADVQDARAAGKAFLDDYVSADGRVVRRNQGDDTVSEGQAFGMLIAVALEDRPRFDRIWRWTQANLQRSDDLLSFGWADGAVNDPRVVSGADLDTGRALLIAAERWNDARYRTEALAIGKAILLRETIDLDGRKLLVAGPWARTSPPTVNPGYFSPRAFQAFLAATGDRRWKELQATGIQAIDGLTRKPPSLPPDWAAVRDGAVEPTHAPTDRASGVRYAYEGARVMPQYAEMCPDPEPSGGTDAPAVGRRLVARAWPFMESLLPDGPTADLRANGRPIGGNRNAIATVAAAATADAAGDTASRDLLLVRAGIDQQETRGGENYYGAAWLALGRIMLTTDLLGRCSTDGGIG